MKNKYKLLQFFAAVLLVFVITGSSVAQYTMKPKQKVEFSATGSYLFGGIWPVSNGELNIVNNYGFQSELSYRITPSTSAGISYTYIPSELRFRNFMEYGNETKIFDMDIHYFYLNYILEKQNRNSAPYFLVGLGGSIFDPKDNSYGSEFRFATTIGGGIKIYPSQKVGFKIQARLLMPISYASTGVFVGTSGVGYGVGATSALIQADLSAGIIIKF